ncbi:MAG TPA: SCE4755 family polysaccharide monooxygenase-like protein [Polyangiaceae bacterium]|nr:SCE4755 family polysaccharide monooxygenase-like protein [Polyangiaceae bacterium]
MKKLLLVLSFPLLCVSASAQAHFNLDAPTPNTTTTDGGMSSPPCGVGTASGVITPVQGGHALTLQIDEFVPHTGFYRVALAIDSVSELPVDDVVKDANGMILPPTGKPSGISASAVYEDPAVFPVLGDHLLQHDGTMPQMFQTNITLPNVNCAKCTLQVVEFMEGHPFNTAIPPDTGPGGGYFYRHCADLKITADPSMPVFVPPAGTGGGSSTSGGAGGMVSTAGAGGAFTSSGAGQTSSGGASVGTGGSAEASGAGAAGASTSADNGGCSCSLGRRSAASRAFASLLLGVLLLARRRARGGA